MKKNNPKISQRGSKRGLKNKARLKRKGTVDSYAKYLKLFNRNASEFNQNVEKAGNVE